jgi:hypothetical protein
MPTTCTLFLTTALLLVPVPPADEAPSQSADVVKVTLRRHSLADGLETFFVTLEIAEGWEILAHKPGPLRPVASLSIEFFLDGNRAWTHDIYYPEGKERRDAAGYIYRVNTEWVGCTGWLAWEDTSKADVISVQVHVVAERGNTRLKPSVLKAETR